MENLIAAFIVTVNFGLIDMSVSDCYKVQSTAIEQICFNGQDTTLVQFKHTHKWYAYCGTNPDVFIDFINAYSIGRHFNKHIRNNFACQQ